MRRSDGAWAGLVSAVRCGRTRKHGLAELAFGRHAPRPGNRPGAGRRRGRLRGAEQGKAGSPHAHHDGCADAHTVYHNAGHAGCHRSSDHAERQIPAAPGYGQTAENPLTVTPTPAPTTPRITTTPEGEATTPTTKATTPSTGAGRSTSEENQPASILLDTNAASTYNPYNYPESDFGDPSLTIDGDTTTGWTAIVEPATAPEDGRGRADRPEDPAQARRAPARHPISRDDRRRFTEPTARQRPPRSPIQPGSRSAIPS